ncbi:MAG: putative zinc-binding metallopeptidase [Rikenellaceae bacterium]|nr:putative zinc-binding metallopeptidase [Rikenellaceae bacterium]
MKPTFLHIALLAVVALSVSCKEELAPESIFVDPVSKKTDFDLWLDRHYVEPYNIRFEYRLPDRETHFNYWVTPPPVAKAVEVAKVIEYTTLEALVELMSHNEKIADPSVFAKTYFPKVLYLVGSYEIDFDGTVVLGSAENGLQINILGVTNFDRTKGDGGIAGLLLHEFTHILDGQHPVTGEYRAIGAGDYVGDTYTSADDTYLQKGFLSNYARSSPAEDIAVTCAALIGESDAWWNSRLQAAGEEGRTKLENKRTILKAWLRESYGVDWELWHTIYTRRLGSLENIDWDTLED